MIKKISITENKKFLFFFYGHYASIVAYYTCSFFIPKMTDPLYIMMSFLSIILGYALIQNALSPSANRVTHRIMVCFYVVFYMVLLDHSYNSWLRSFLLVVLIYPICVYFCLKKKHYCKFFIGIYLFFVFLLCTFLYKFYHDKNNFLIYVFVFSSVLVNEVFLFRRVNFNLDKK